jgi:mRNA-degrading endonuclease toxin of MazEF toxin-antitoxin module
MKRGDIYMVSLEPTLGHEQRGLRPVLVISSESFNRMTQVPLVVPITTGGNFARVAGFTVSMDGFGMQTVGLLRCDQVRCVDLTDRGGRRVGSAPQELVDEVLAKLGAIFEI